MLRIDVRSSRELQALILSIRQANKEVQAQIRKHTKPVVEKEWRKALAEQATTLTEHRILVDTARTTVSNQNVKLRSGTLAKKLSGGAKAFEIAAQTEFGATPHPIQYTRTRRGNTHQVKRQGSTQFRRPNKRGYVVYPAAAQIIPRIAALWVQTTIRTFAEQVERK